VARLVSNPPNPWSSHHVEWLEEPPTVATEVFEEDARSALSENRSPDVPFRFSVNPYRGCAHACAYCYARPGHQHLGFGAGTDFDQHIVIKTNVHELLARELARPRMRGERIAFSGVTDPYQPLEASYELTRRCLEVCLQRGNPVGIITKSALVRRDVELLAKLARGPGAHVYVSIPFLDEAHARAIEPGAPTPARRFETLQALADAGVPTGVAVAPLIPGLNDADAAGILERAAAAGAQRAFCILLRLVDETRLVFEERLRATLPERASRVLNALEEMGGATRAGFGRRMAGSGERWRAVEELFRLRCRKLGLEHGEAVPELPAGSAGDCPLRQGELFE
jgi:DNA repair photolyase